MNPKTKSQLSKAVKAFVGIIATLFYEEGVRFIIKIAEQWLEARAKKAKTSRSRAQRKKS